MLFWGGWGGGRLTARVDSRKLIKRGGEYRVVVPKIEKEDETFRPKYLSSLKIKPGQMDIYVVQQLASDSIDNKKSFNKNSYS